jgi:hypothetical protein
MTKKKKIKPKLPNNVDEQQFLNALDNISKRLGNKFKFGYHSYEDMKQQAAIFALEGLEKYDSSRPLENFLWTHVRNRLFNFKRDNYQRPDLPCANCPLYDKLGKNSSSNCLKYTDKTECELYNNWLVRNTNKKNIMKLYGSENLHEIHKHENDINHNISNQQIFDIIETHIPSQHRELYLKYRYGDKLSKTNQNKIVKIIKQILKDHIDDIENS